MSNRKGLRKRWSVYVNNITSKPSVREVLKSQFDIDLTDEMEYNPTSLVTLVSKDRAFKIAEAIKAHVGSVELRRVMVGTSR